MTEAKKVISVGKISGAVGTYATVPPEVEQKACRKLGLTPAPISNQVLQRDRHAQFVTTLAIMAGSLEKFATEIRALQKTEVREVEEPFGGGSDRLIRHAAQAQPGAYARGSAAWRGWCGASP